MTLFHKVWIFEWEAPMWFIQSPYYWESVVGSRILRLNTDKILEKQEGSDWAELNWIDTLIHKPDAKTGFVAPDGRFYGCIEHDIFAYLFLKSSIQELDDAGWVKTWRDSWQCLRRLTPEQRITLQHRGCHILETD